MDTAEKKASPFESEIHPSHKSGDLYKGHFAPAEGLRLCPGVDEHRRSRKPPGAFRCCPIAAAARQHTGDGGRETKAGTEVNDGTAQLYPDVKAV